MKRDVAPRHRISKALLTSDWTRATVALSVMSATVMRGWPYLTRQAELRRRRMVQLDVAPAPDRAASHARINSTGEVSYAIASTVV